MVQDQTSCQLVVTTVVSQEWSFELVSNYYSSQESEGLAQNCWVIAPIRIRPPSTS